MTQIIAIDQGTTSSRAILFNADGSIADLRQKELKLHFPNKGWVEQDPRHILNDSLWACRPLVSDQVAAISITNQRETTVVWDRKTGEAIYNAIVWQDRRTAETCARLKAQGHEEAVRQKTGLLLDPYFSATKLAWILDNVDGARARAEKGELAFGTVDTWLLWHLTGRHLTDVTNASRTLLYNIVEQRWDDDLLELFNIPASLLPEVKDNMADFGSTKPGVLDRVINIGGVAGDQQAALIGQACFETGMVKSTYGTGCFALMNIGTEFKTSDNRLLTTAAYRCKGELHYALEGSIFAAGTAVQWLRDELKFFAHAAESEALARSVPDNNGVYMVPAFTGLGAPHWDPDALATISGLSRESSAAHITRAALEAQAYQSFDLMSAMEADCGESPAVIRADGGLVANGFVCQFLADILDKPVEIPAVAETTAWGAASLAAVQAGVFADLGDVSAAWSAQHSYAPKMADAERQHLLAGWRQALNRTLTK